MTRITLGGERVGSGKKMKVDLHEYGRTTFDLSRVFRTSTTNGVITPFLVEQVMRGDTVDIDLTTLVRTLPTVGPLFGSFKLQLDVFEVPSRLYMKEIHNDKLDIGQNMASVKYPWLLAGARTPVAGTGDPNQTQISTSALSAYLGLRGLGTATGGAAVTRRKIQVVPWLAYADIYKNYFANKQEKEGVIVTSRDTVQSASISGLRGYNGMIGDLNATPRSEHFTNPSLMDELRAISNLGHDPGAGMTGAPSIPTFIRIYGTGLRDLTELKLSMARTAKAPLSSFNDLVTAAAQQFDVLAWIQANPETVYYHDSGEAMDVRFWTQDGVIPDVFIDTFAQSATNGWILAFLPGRAFDLIDGLIPTDWEPKIANTTSLSTDAELRRFDLGIIDRMREYLLANSAIDPGVGITGFPEFEDLYKWMMPCTTTGQEDDTRRDTQVPALSGLMVRTYLSDRFNNWLDTETIDGPGGITEITSIDTSTGSFSMDTLNLAQKLYNLLNRIAVAGNSYHDWHTATWGGSKSFACETPIYLGGMAAEIQFDEVVAHTQQEGPNDIGTNRALGSLAGRGADRGHKGGRLKKRIEEEGYIIGVMSIVPRIDYTSGNKWYLRHQGPDDLHKPELDQIGFQDLLTDEIAAWDTDLDANGVATYKSVGKQPAYTEYTTAVNEAFGDFAIDNRGMFMTLTRRYEPQNGANRVADLTSYIDPGKYNFAFATTGTREHCFWVMIGIDMKIRRKMSGKIMPKM